MFLCQWLTWLVSKAKPNRHTSHPPPPFTHLCTLLFQLCCSPHC